MDPKPIVNGCLKQCPCIQVHSSLKTSILHHDKMLTVRVPGSKSITNRVLLIAALGKGKVRLGNFLKSADTIAMLEAMKSLSLATFDWENESENVLIVNGNGGARLESAGPATNEYTLHVNNSGTAARFLTSLAVIIAGQYKRPVIVTGNDQIKKRPIDSLVDALNSSGCKIEYLEKEGKLPLALKDFKGLPGGHIKLDAQISSQYVSSILMTAPYANKPVTLELQGHIVSRGYIDMTVALMKSFGITVTQPKPNIFQIPTGTYTNPPDFIIEPDASTATYPMAIAAILGRSVKIPHLGTGSLQGDAGFAPVILKKMGCKVVQNSVETVVYGPPIGGLRPLGTVDMEPLTDSFLTAAVLAAVATDRDSNCSTIIGISNQRIKECNRISAMANQLAKFGIQTEELEDGLKIYGQDYTKVKCFGTVHCFDDHRVAMSFSVLGSLVSCIIRDRGCTKKTWPEWWDVLSNVLQVQLTPVDLISSALGLGPKVIYQPHEHTTQCIESSTMETNTPTVLFIGMRGVGKTTLGQHVAQLLSKKFVDMDDFFYETYKVTANEFIKAKGFDVFRIVELECLNLAVTKWPTNAIISCGGGIIETEEGRSLFQTLKKRLVIIHLMRDLAQILKEPSFAEKVPYGEEVGKVWERRLPIYQKCSTHEIFLSECCSWKANEHQLAKFIQNCYFPNYSLLHLNKIKSKTTSPTLLLHTFLNEPKKDAFATKVKRWIHAESNELPNMAEFRIIADPSMSCLTKIHSTVAEIGQRYFLLKCLLAKLPVVLTFTAGDQRRPTGINEEWLAQFTNELVRSAIKWNVDIICLDEVLKIQLLNEATKCLLKESKIITATLYNGPTLEITLNMTRHPDVFIRRSSLTKGLQDEVELIQIEVALEKVSPSSAALLNGKFLVTSQNQMKDINVKLTMKNELTPKQFYLFGYPISSSKSPMLHNVGFTATNLPYTYHLYESKQIDADFVKLVTNPATFGGASVTIPMKEKVYKELDRISDAGKLIGAVNTLYVNENGKLVGDNTDYIGIMKVMEPTLKNIEQIQNGEGKIAEQTLRGLVIGGGGTARAAIFALLSIPAVKHITVVNRNVLKVVQIVEEFRCTRKWGQEAYNEGVILEADSLESLNCTCFDPIHKPNIIISTIPCEAQKESCKFSKELLKDVSIVVEMVYGKKTPLLEAIEQADNAKNIVVYDGGQVVVEQGLKQFEIWTGLSTPFEKMRSTVSKQFEEERKHQS